MGKKKCPMVSIEKTKNFSITGIIGILIKFKVKFSSLISHFYDRYQYLKNSRSMIFMTEKKNLK